MMKTHEKSYLMEIWEVFGTLYDFVVSRTRFRVNPHSIVALMSRNSLLEAAAKSEGEVTATGLQPRTT